MKPSLKNWFINGWYIYKKQWINVVMAYLTIFALSLFFVLLPKYFSFFAIFVIPILYIGFNYLCINAVKNESKFSHLFEGFKRYGASLGVHILYSLIVISGIILMILPGIIWAISNGLASFAMLDKKLSPIQALQLSRKITAGHRFKLFIIGLVKFIGNCLTILNSKEIGEILIAKSHILKFILQQKWLGWICCFIGIGLLIPFSTCTFAVAYTELSEEAE